MPIDIDRFENGSELRGRPTSQRIVWFLWEHDGQAFTRREIADAIDAAPETVGTNLSRLKDRGLVRHREPYWAVSDDRGHVIAEARSRYGEDFIADLDGEADADPRAAHPTNGDANSDDPDRTDSSPGPSPPDGEEASDRGTDPSSASPDSGKTRHRAAAMAVAERVNSRLEDAVEALYLFGSVARDATTATSDVDVLAVVADDADYAAVDDQLLDIAYDVQLEYGIPVEVHSIRATEFATRKERGEPFVSMAVEEGECLG